MLKWLKLFIPVLILGTGIAFIFAFEFYLKDKVYTIPVIVAAEDIAFKESLTAENTEVVHIRRDHVIQGAYSPEVYQSEVLGQLSAIEIKKGTQLYSALIDHHNLTPRYDRGEFIAPIPNRWIYAVPGSLRRSYHADFYVTKESNDVVLEIDEKSGMSDIELDTKPILSNVKVLHTRDSSNREVRNIQESEYDATANISNIEIIATEKMLNTMKTYVEQGYKLYITYKQQPE
ncbi:SAF domain-containing protein [Caldalkalibacillus salinus]|uniref:SAF domain-containing protein n=1 Tax=Caldalkalibacillus salinus TaxID=2803787 RepID=UPI001923A390|nr:SAF domain-containing protein [Caldalkalibacillus salinus]